MAGEQVSENRQGAQILRTTQLSADGIIVKYLALMTVLFPLPIPLYNACYE